MNTEISLSPHEIPLQWLNIAPDLPGPKNPPLTANGIPLNPENLQLIFPQSLIEQEISLTRWIDIPQDILEVLSLWRPTPLKRAVNLEKILDTPARIYFKDESVSPPGSHKPNTAVAQAYYNHKEQVKCLTTETGAGQWGSALAFACAKFKLKCQVYMVNISYHQKPLRKTLMKIWGAHCLASPSDTTEFGRTIRNQHPESPGSLGIAISEAVEKAMEDKSGKTKYSLGSVLNMVMMHQSVIGLEAKKQLAKLGEAKVDTVIGCVGGGSNFAGLSFPYLLDKIHGEQIEIIPVEPTSCPTLTRGPYCYDFGDSAGMTPLLAMHSLGYQFIPAPIHAGGLRYHGMAPLVSQAVQAGLLSPQAFPQLQCYQAAVQFAFAEGIVVAPETSHALAAVIEQADKAKKLGKPRVILFNLSGHGMLDLNAYEDYLNGKLTDHRLSPEKLNKSLEALSNFPKPECLINTG
ncbi:MAG: TrpB-like pyridoxal phosphate-dependent enzyme [bacterium]